MNTATSELSASTDPNELLPETAQASATTEPRPSTTKSCSTSSLCLSHRF